MRIIISPAKRMVADTDSLEVQGTPLFLDRAEALIRALQGMHREELRALWHCNDAIVEQNVQRLCGMNLRNQLTPAILAYEGIQYRYMAPEVFEDGHIAYVEGHLRILSGLYGLLQPFDGVVPHRLEMRARLSVGGCKNLYEYWGAAIAEQLSRETACILNLASKEYSKAVAPHLPKRIRLVHCTFGEWQGGKVVEKGTLCKMARGQMVRFLAERGAKVPEDAKSFSSLGYRYSQAHSTPNHMVFLKPSTKGPGK